MLVVFDTETYTNHSSRVMTDYSISRRLSFEKNTLDSISAYFDHDLNSHTYIIRKRSSEESVPKDRKPKKKNGLLACYIREMCSRVKESKNMSYFSWCLWDKQEEIILFRGLV